MVAGAVLAISLAALAVALALIIDSARVHDWLAAAGWLRRE